MRQYLLVPDLVLFWPHASSSCSVLCCPRGITAEQIKNVAGHQAKCTVVLGLVFKRDRHDKTKG